MSNSLVVVTATGTTLLRETLVSTPVLSFVKRERAAPLLLMVRNLAAESPNAELPPVVLLAPGLVNVHLWPLMEATPTLSRHRSSA